MATIHDIPDEMDGESFEQLLNQQTARRDHFSSGDRVTGTVVHVSGENIFVDISGKSEALIDGTEFLENDGTLSIKNGDTIEGFVVSTTGGEIRVTTRIGRGAVTPGILELAFRSGIPVHGTVSGAVKGGFSISVGGCRCFCPASQIDSRQVQDPGDFLNKSFAFKIIEYRERGANIILSRRVLMEEDRSRQEEELKGTLAVGDRVTGTVRSVKNFGIFVDLGGVEGMVPRSELSRSRSVGLDTFAPGQTVTAAVKAIDWDNRKLTLSIKDLEPEPWDTIDRFAQGASVQGNVVNLIKSGAFVELEPGLDGFIPLSRMSMTRKVARPEDVLSIGDAVSVRIVEINRQDRKISLELVTGESDPWKATQNQFMDAIHAGTVESVKPTGLQVRLENGMLGYTPREELAMEPGTDLNKKYAPGSTVRVVVKTFNAGDRKLILSERGALKREERQDFEKYLGGGDSSGSTALGSMFKNQFDKMQKKIGDDGTS